MKHVLSYDEYILEKVNLRSVEKYADAVLDPVDVEFTKHFFERLTRVEHTVELTDAELMAFFDRLSQKPEQLKNFIKKYDEFVVKDRRTDINMAFATRVNQIIGKTIMRKRDFKSPDKPFVL